MTKVNRLFIIGHTGAGKVVLGNALAEKLGWHLVNIDFALEFKIGKTLIDILGPEGIKNFYQCQLELLQSLVKLKNLIVVTGGAIVCDEKNRALLSSEFSIYLNVTVPMQMQRLVRNQPPVLVSNAEQLFKKLHEERDPLYETVAKMMIDADDNSLDKHVNNIIQRLDLLIPDKTIRLEQKDLILFHKKKRIPIHLSEPQAICIKLLSAGKSSKEIARETNISHRTVESYIAKAMSLLGCKSSKELIALYLEHTSG